MKLKPLLLISVILVILTQFQVYCIFGAIGGLFKKIVSPITNLIAPKPPPPPPPPPVAEPPPPPQQPQYSQQPQYPQYPDQQAQGYPGQAPQGYPGMQQPYGGYGSNMQYPSANPGGYGYRGY